MNVLFASKLFPWKENGLHLFLVGIEHVQRALNKYHHFLELLTEESALIAAKI